MPPFDMTDYFDFRIKYNNSNYNYYLRAINADADFVTLFTFDSTKTYKLKITKSGGKNYLNITEETPDPNNGFVSYFSSNIAFNCYFFQEFVGSALGGIIGIGDVRPENNKPMRITKLDGASFEAYLKFTVDSNNVTTCLIKDSSSTVNTLSAFKNAANQTFYKVLS